MKLTQWVKIVHLFLHASCVKTVLSYDFKLIEVVLHLSVKEHLVNNSKITIVC